jgi:hypothetical protein
LLHLLLLCWEQIALVHCAEVVTNEINFIDEDHYIKLTKHIDVEINKYDNEWEIPNHVQFEVWESIIEDYQEDLIDARLMTKPTVSKTILMKIKINID